MFMPQMESLLFVYTPDLNSCIIRRMKVNPNLRTVEGQVLYRREIPPATSLISKDG